MWIEVDGPTPEGDYTFIVDGEAPTVIPEEVMSYLLARGFRAFIEDDLFENLRTLDASI